MNSVSLARLVCACARVCVRVDSLPVEDGQSHGAPGCGHAGYKAPHAGLGVPPGPHGK